MKHLIFVMLVLSGCAGSLPATRVAQVEAVSIDTALEVCTLAHQLNQSTHTGAQQDTIRAKIDEVCIPALKAMAFTQGIDIAKALDDLKAALKEVVQ